jgi:hypothetical protein
MITKNLPGGRRISIQTATKKPSIGRRTRVLVVNIKGRRGSGGTLLVAIKGKRRSARR